MKLIKGFWSTLAVMGILAVMIGFKHTEVMDPAEKTAIADEMKKVSAQAQAEAKQASAAKASAEGKQIAQKPANTSAE
ncbi:MULTISPECIES: hypothetical protein [Bacillaceae]|uniref:Uncharacterized protein n=1 Tax=Metabacillus sediminis TaxID=3117746 RepID=A0ABZ2NF43_9BACI|nr:hypothetical protein [Bacillus sp. SJS]KZZ82570.1 hypothetical protein AS29_020400 [Bacillus sp. SJS]